MRLIHLVWISDRASGLQFQAGRSAVPELNGLISSVQHSGSVAFTVLTGNAQGDWQAIGKAVKWTVAAGAGDTSVQGEPRVVVKLAAEGNSICRCLLTYFRVCDRLCGSCRAPES